MLIGTTSVREDLCRLITVLDLLRGGPWPWLAEDSMRREAGWLLGRVIAALCRNHKLVRAGWV